VLSAPSAHRPWRGLLLIWLAALLLDLWGIQQGPLRDWDESLVARIALELSEKPWPDLLLPTLWGEPYANKPPGAHWLIAGLIQLWRGHAPAGALPPEWLLRLAPALGSSLLSPLLGLVQWQLRPGRRADALWTAAIALTLLPLARHAHLVMLDGLLLTAMASLWLGLLLARPGRRWALAGGLLAGLAASALLLLKAPVAPPLLLGGLALRWVDGDLSRRAWRWLLIALVLGLLPGLAWHAWHLACRGEDALVMWGRQGLARVVSGVENHGGGPLPPLIQVLSGGWPWLLLWPAAIGAAWRQRRARWGRWILGLTTLVSLLVLPLQTQLPWYSLLLWPPFALGCGPLMAALVSGAGLERLRHGMGRIWLVMAALLLTAVLISPLIPGLRSVAGIALPAGLGLLAAGLVLGFGKPSHQQRRRVAWGLVLGWSLSLLSLFSTPLWNWELSEQPSIKPLLPLVSRNSRSGDLAALPLLVEGVQGHRPSLQWYAQDTLHPQQKRDLRSAKGLLLVSQATSVEQTRLARKLGSDRINSNTCSLERSGAAGWRRWLCQPG
jgi:4-amino-4-deoxy-L-arabinose transferase-like glycosyltransferase